MGTAWLLSGVTGQAPQHRDSCWKLFLEDLRVTYVHLLPDEHHLRFLGGFVSEGS